MSRYDWRALPKYEFKIRRRVLRDFYRRWGITKVKYEFGGGGDSGELYDTTYFRGDQEFTPKNVGYEYNTKILDLVEPWNLRLHDEDIVSDPVPRLTNNELWRVESALGFGLMVLVGEDGWWNDTGGRCSVVWALTTDAFDVEVVEYIMTEGTPRRTQVIEPEKDISILAPPNKAQK